MPFYLYIPPKGQINKVTWLVSLIAAKNGGRHVIIYFSDAEALEQPPEEYDNEEQTLEQRLTFRRGDCEVDC